MRLWAVGVPNGLIDYTIAPDTRRWIYRLKRQGHGRQEIAQLTALSLEQVERVVGPTKEALRTPRGRLIAARAWFAEELELPQVEEVLANA